MSLNKKPTTLEKKSKGKKSERECFQLYGTAQKTFSCLA